MTVTDLSRYAVVATPAPVTAAVLRTDVAGFAGRTTYGPAGRPVPIHDPAEFAQVFGPPVAGGMLAAAMAGYFANGGRLAYVVRLLGAGATAATGRLELGGTVPVDVTAGSPGAWADGLPVIATLRAGAAGRPDWTVSAGAGGEFERAAALADAAAALRLATLDIPEGALPPAVGRWTTRLHGGTDGGPVGAPQYRDATRALVEQPDVALLALPDLWADLGDDGYALLGEIARAVHATLDRLLLADLPPSANDSTVAAVAALARLDQNLLAPEARAVAVYHPWMKVADLSGPPDAEPLTVPPCGHVAGQVSRLDRERGPARTPAGVPLAGVVDLAGPRPPGADAVLADHRANPIRPAPGRGLVVWGGRTFDPALDARFVAHRRLTHRLIRAARQVAGPLVFEPDGPALHLALTRAVTTVLLAAYRGGALAGSSPAEAFAVSTTGQGELVVCELRFAPVEPMEFITVRITLGPEGRLEVIEQ